MDWLEISIRHKDENAKLRYQNKYVIAIHDFIWYGKLEIRIIKNNSPPIGKTGNSSYPKSERHKWRKLSKLNNDLLLRTLNTIATYGNERNFTLVNIYGANEPREFLLG